MVFFLSGLSSLIYQVAWQRLLTLHYGVGSVAITLIVSVYMLGLGLGALLGGQLSERTQHRLLAYSVIELLIGVFGAVSLPFLDLLGSATAGSSYAASFVAMFVFLLAPTLLMGMTLPLLVKAFNRMAPDFLRSVSLLYFVNTLGAAAGALLAAYGLISFWGLGAAVYAAAVLNVGLAAAAFGIARLAREGATHPAMEPGRPPAPPEPGLGAWAYPLVFASGFLAIGYELVWFRVIGVLIKASPYAFATSLSVYLLGIALGSYGVERLVRRRPELSRVGLFFGFQLLTGLSVLVLVGGLAQLGGSGAVEELVEATFRRRLHPASWAVGDLLGVFAWPVFFQLVPTLLIGASFPLLASLALSRPEREGATIGRVYFVNTMGNLLGGVISGFVLIEALGSERTLLCFASVNLAMLILAPRLFSRPLALPRRLALAGLGVAAGILWFPGPGELYQVLHREPGPGYKVFIEEGVDSVVVTYKKGPWLSNFINGTAHGGRPLRDFTVEALEALAVAPRSEEVLVIGFGTGTITEAILESPDLEKLTLVELNRTLIENLQKMKLFQRILSDSRIELVYDDGRRHLMRSDALYDAIFMDALSTTTAYSNNLYSAELMELAAGRLSECGVLLLWTDDLFVVPRTAASVFPEVAFYELSAAGGFLLGSRCPLSRSESRLRALLERMPADLRASLAERMGALRPAARRDELLRITDGLPINRDRRPRSEYYLGLDPELRPAPARQGG